MLSTINSSKTQQRLQYWETGYLTLPNFFSQEEIDRLSAECDRLSTQESLFTQHIPEAATRTNLAGEIVRDRLDPVIHLSDRIRQMVYDTRLLQVLRDLFDDEPILFKDKLILKPPGTKGYDLHQDYAYWEQLGVPADALLSVQVAIDAADADNGAIVLYPGLHQHRLPAPPDHPRDVSPTAVQSTDPVLVSTQPGDLLIFHSLTPHYSAPNRSQAPRRTLYLTYNSQTWGDYYKSYYGDRLKTG
ncbi:phytanoyl-CoA dioxygenase family protein [Leptolyngbya ohadii]|uniref:phytanoyl-CoA dioxygenase family protein n=1 Tax=Leptolyngbya ohadii TaxID=1962290 RepID=UPI0015C65BC5|nr:phytanoyl-CoA dioxygenase family protein [Leptolyngbya ohadii]